MLEPWRSRYLEVMGLTSYVARMPLAGAAPSRAVAWDGEAIDLTRSAEVAPPVEAAAPERTQKLSRRLPEIAPATQSVASSVPAKGQSAAASRETAVSIALLMVSLNPHVLLIDDSRAITSTTHPLLGNVARSIGGALTEEELFRWPSVAHPQLSRSAGAAREAIVGRLLRRLEGKPPQTLLLLGRSAEWLDSKACDGLGSAVSRLVVGPALSDVLASAAAKREFWLALRSIAFD